MRIQKGGYIYNAAKHPRDKGPQHDGSYVCPLYELHILLSCQIGELMAAI
jgi:hypothetical protein